MGLFPGCISLGKSVTIVGSWSHAPMQRNMVGRVGRDAGRFLVLESLFFFLISITLNGITSNV